MQEDDLKEYLFFRDKYKDKTKNEKIRLYNLLNIATNNILNNRTQPPEDKSSNIVSIIFAAISIVLAIKSFVENQAWVDGILLLLCIVLCIFAFYYLNKNDKYLKEKRADIIDENNTLRLNNLELQALKDLLADDGVIIN